MAWRIGVVSGVLHGSALAHCSKKNFPYFHSSPVGYGHGVIGVMPSGRR